MSFSRHAVVIAAFGQYFAHPGKVPVELHRFLLEAQELRHSGDYGQRHTVTCDQARQQITRAEQFLEVAERFIDLLPPPPESTA